MKIKKIITNLSLSIGLISLTATSVQAMTPRVNLLSYEGWEIWSWRSIDDFNLSSSKYVTVSHSQTRDTALSTTKLNVDVRKHAFIGSSSQFDEDFTGDSSGSFSGTLSEGKYYIRFESSARAKTFNIDGSVYY